MAASAFPSITVGLALTTAASRTGTNYGILHGDRPPYEIVGSLSVSLKLA
jgi:hypothetical protein